MKLFKVLCATILIAGSTGASAADTLKFQTFDISKVLAANRLHMAIGNITATEERSEEMLKWVANGYAAQAPEKNQTFGVEQVSVKAWNTVPAVGIESTQNQEEYVTDGRGTTLLPEGMKLVNVYNPKREHIAQFAQGGSCLLYTSPSPRDRTRSRMPSSA